MKPWTRLVLLSVLAVQMSGADPLSVTISVGTTGEPISKYLYGQFIEHLGRGMYGGLWAEMLEDRKFFFVVRDRYAPWGTTDDPNWDSGPFDYLRASPWKVIGPAGTVSMETEKPFVGIHSPVVRLNGSVAMAGLSQEGLALKNGKSYAVRITLRGDPGVQVAIRLAGDLGELVEHRISTLSQDFQTLKFVLKSPSESNNAKLEVLGNGNGQFEVGAVSLMPDDALDGWRPEVIALLKELDAPIYRWPGGNFVSGYDWKDGIGDRDTRPPRQNPAWRGVESNDVGLHEFLGLMALIGSEPYIALNTGLGTAESAAQEVEYCVGSPDSPMGKWRAAQGHADPFLVHYWAVGNEMFGPWQLGFLPVADYVKKHNEVAAAIRLIDPTARLVGVGAIGAWDQAILSGSAGFLDLISEHIYRKALPDVNLHSGQLAADIESVALAHRNYRKTLPSLEGRDIRISMDEWNYWYGPYRYGELGVQYHLKDALGVARALHAFFRNSDLYWMANYAQTVNVLGAIKTSRTAATLDTTGLVLALYRHHFGSIPVNLSGDSGNLDISVALTSDRKILTFSIVNPGPSERDLSVKLDSGFHSDGCTLWVLSGADPESTNRPGQAPGVTVEQSLQVKLDPFLKVPGYSVVLVRIE